MTCDQNHGYGPEQYANNGGKNDQFVQNTDSGKCSGNLFGEPGLVMDYYDGNTVTALWNYAQNYSLGDRSYSSVYGPSTPGALNLVSGQTHGVVSMDPASGTEHPKQTTTPDSYTVQSPDAKGVGTVVNDPDPAYDDCSDKDHTSTNALAAMQGRNIGDVLNSKDVSWGWFQGGFRPSTPWDGQQGHYAKCDATHTNVGGAAAIDYSPHHSPFEYYKSTSNPHHLPPRNVDEIGHSGQANHNYDLTDFSAALKAGKLPAVSFLKAAEYQDGHAAYSDPIDSSTSWSTRSTRSRSRRSGSRPPWSSRTTTPTAGTTTRTPSRATAPRTPRSAPTARPPTARPPGRTGGDGRLRGPLRPRHASAAARGLPYSKVNKRPHPDRPVVDHPLHRGQLAHEPDRRPLLRRRRRLPRRYVRLPAPEQQAGAPELRRFVIGRRSTR